MSTVNRNRRTSKEPETVYLFIEQNEKKNQGKKIVSLTNVEIISESCISLVLILELTWVTVKRAPFCITITDFPAN